MKNKKDVISGAALQLLGLLVFASSFGIATTSFSQYGATLVPRLVAGTLVLLGTIILFSGLRGHTAAEGEALHKKELIQVLICTASLLVYVLALRRIGFIIMTTLLITVETELLSNWDARRLPIYICIAAVFTIAVYLLFTRLFFLVLPAGILG